MKQNKAGERRHWNIDYRSGPPVPMPLRGKIELPACVHAEVQDGRRRGSVANLAKAEVHYTILNGRSLSKTNVPSCMITKFRLIHSTVQAPRHSEGRSCAAIVYAKFRSPVSSKDC